MKKPRHNNQKAFSIPACDQKHKEDKRLFYFFNTMYISHLKLAITGER